MNIDTRYEESEITAKSWRVLQIVAFWLCVFLLFNLAGCASTDISEASNACGRGFLHAYSSNTDNGVLQVVCK